MSAWNGDGSTGVRFVLAGSYGEVRWLLLVVVNAPEVWGFGSLWMRSFIR